MRIRAAAIGRKCSNLEAHLTARARLKVGEAVMEFIQDNQISQSLPEAR